MRMRAALYPVLLAALMTAGCVHAQPRVNAGQAPDMRVSDCRNAAQTTIDINSCLQVLINKREENVALMSDVELSSAVALDKEMPGFDVTRNFEESVHAFEAYVESACAHKKAMFTNGSGSGTAYLSCKLALLDQRIAFLSP